MITNISTLSDDCGSLCAGSTFVGQGDSFMEEESWKAVPAMPGVEASSMGRVRLNGEVKPQHLTGKFYKTGRGYYAVSLKLAGPRKPHKIHRLVATAFHPNPLNLPQVNHIDGTTMNNRPENLEWCDNSHNQRHARDTGLHIALKGAQVTTAVIDSETAMAIYEAVHRDHGKHRDVAKKYGISKTQVTRIASRKAWAHIHE